MGPWATPPPAHCGERIDRGGPGRGPSGATACGHRRAPRRESWSSAVRRGPRPAGPSRPGASPARSARSRRSSGLRSIVPCTLAVGGVELCSQLVSHGPSPPLGSPRRRPAVRERRRAPSPGHARRRPDDVEVHDGCLVATHATRKPLALEHPSRVSHSTDGAGGTVDLVGAVGGPLAFEVVRFITRQSPCPSRSRSHRPCRPREELADLDLLAQLVGIGIIDPTSTRCFDGGTLALAKWPSAAASPACRAAPCRRSEWRVAVGLRRLTWTTRTGPALMMVTGIARDSSSKI